MIQQLLLALALTSVTVSIHVIGTVHGVLPATRLWTGPLDRGGSLGPVLLLIRLVSGLLLLHLAEIVAWAGAFAVAGVLPGFETSLYYSLMSYTTVGYGDVLPTPTWRLVGPIEAAVGVLMLGLSTGVLVAAVQRLYSRPFERSSPDKIERGPA
jgi:hypothetical protein